MIRLSFWCNKSQYMANLPNINTNPTYSIFINSNGGALPIRSFLSNISTNVGWTVGNQFRSSLATYLAAFCDDSLDVNDVNYGFPCFHFEYSTPSELADIISTFSGFKVNLKLSGSLSRGGSWIYSPYIECVFDFSNVANDLLIVSSTRYNIDYYDNCGYSNFDICNELIGTSTGVFSAFTNSNSNYEFKNYNPNPYPSCGYEPPVDCEDLRTSESTQGVYITANWKDIIGNQFSEDYTLLFQPDSQHTSGSISMSSSNFKGLMGLAGVSCRFNRGIVRDSGYIKINGHITANKYTVDMLGNTLVPVFNDVTENFIIQFSFEACCDYPSVISETYSDALAALDIDSAELVMAQVDFDTIEWNGFSLLTDYCCDDVDCDGVEFEGDDEPIYKGIGGGGDTVDITCICDNLALINTTLANKFDGLNGKMDSLIETIEDKELTVELDDCICDNLESISDKLDSLDDIKDSIDNKVIPVTDVSSVANAITNKQIPITDVSGITTAINNKQIPVTDVSGITTAINNKQIPVTNVSGIESAITNKQIPVTDVSGLNTSLGNIDNSLGQIDNSIAGGTASIGSSIDDLDISLGGISTSLGGIDTSIDGVGTAISNQSFSVDTTGLTCTDSQGNEEGLACILKNALNNRDNKGLADVIDDKDVTSYVDVAVEPYDMVNIRRAFKDDDIQEG